ncbi:hypothetical protein NA57DRAFT_62257 [Rhizodiscina lignyota]|uniref:Heterokaryon incompatibility domain-containing protein n=1 Tax=Rhizodiscina lignyota TaxID=1504668 RepID=A0A9P4I5C2_9PEZI|nr:hypothetical protein NA57DRAFT_62257 [Rhizodiscina lignyota]
MSSFFPEEESEWPAFREWAIVRTSCLVASEITGSDPESQDDSVSGLERGLLEPSQMPVEYFELMEWMMDIDYFLAHPNEKRNPFRLTSSFYFASQPGDRIQPPYRVYEAKSREALEQGKSLGICPNRLWNVVSGSPRLEFDLVGLMTAINNVPARTKFGHKESKSQIAAAAPIIPTTSSGNHTACAPDLCHFAFIDSTGVKILHKCPGQNCTRLDFTPLVTGQPPYIWSIDDAKFTHPGKNKYVAISHVWSDGTGAENGVVNKCMLEYFQDIAVAAGCRALWWDAISILIDPTLRSEAIKNMHTNFSDARCTVVHNQYTVGYPWREDGSPCIALALSPWFTRGWTALELLVSEQVKVIFRHPMDENRYELKDLKTEILASNPVCSRGHWIASTVIRRLCDSKVESLSDVLHILGTRSTSWPRDRLTIASLISGLKPDDKDPEMQAIITQDLIIHFGKVDPKFLLHGGPTEGQGVFSWCPSTLVIGAKPNIPSGFTPSEWLSVHSDGTLTGQFITRVLESQDIERLMPFTTHPSGSWKVQCALNNWQQCMLIWPEANDGLIGTPAILVTVLGLDILTIDTGNKSVLRPRAFLDCRMEGLCYGQQGSERACVRLGKKIDNPSAQSAKDLYDQWQQRDMDCIYDMRE